MPLARARAREAKNGWPVLFRFAESGWGGRDYSEHRKSDDLHRFAEISWRAIGFSESEQRRGRS